jgi:hypothetical protein
LFSESGLNIKWNYTVLGDARMQRLWIWI